MTAGGVTREAPGEEVTIDTVLSRLAAAGFVDGLALYCPTSASVPGSDYDVLVLVTERPHGVAQLLTYVEERVTDVLFMDVATYDRVLAGKRRLATPTVESVFMLKLRRARVILDRSKRLERGQQAARQEVDWLRVPSYSSRYLLWFSLNFGLAHMQRMSRSTDPTYGAAVDMLLASHLGTACRAYFDARQLPWKGDKAAVRYLRQHDPEHFELLRACFDAGDRGRKLVLFERLAERTLAPLGGVLKSGGAAVSLEAPVHDEGQVKTALDFFQHLLSGSPP